MTIGISSFIYQANSFAKNQNSIFAHAILEGLKSSFLGTSENWELDSDIECMGNFTESNYNPKLTFQIHNVVTGEYVRIWFAMALTSTSSNNNFANAATVVTVDTAQTEGTATGLFIHKANINVQQNSSGNPIYDLYSNVIIGVSDSSIGKDFGYALQLKCPLFGIVSTGYERTSVLIANMPYGTTVQTFKLTVISNGDGFVIVGHSSGGSDSAFGCVYSRDMITTRSGDLYTACGVSFGGSSSSDTSCYYSSPSSSQAFYYNASGSSDYIKRCWVSRINSLVHVSEASDVLACIPLICYADPEPYLGNNTNLIKDGIGYKGITNMNYIRYVSSLATNYGISYGNQQWLCIGEGILVPWAPNYDADSPFVLS